MKICTIICEYNPFHNGHLYQLQKAKELTCADAVVCIMSGNFVQRGESAILDKYTRAKHAILAGADAVIELPTIFATSNAELFAKGAVNILSSIPAVTTLCFGAETEDKSAFITSAKLLSKESEEISQKIKELLKTGISYAKARATAYEDKIDSKLLSSPNNVLGLEYTKALLNAHIEILPVKRVGNAYNDEELANNFSSATAIRNHLSDLEKIKDNLPDFVYNDLPKTNENQLNLLEKYAILSKSEEEIKRVCDCTEGLENALKKVAESGGNFVKELTSLRYTSSRIKRIALHNLLQIEESLIRESLRFPLYLKILAIKNKRKDLLSALSESEFPTLLRAHDDEALSPVAKVVYEKDLFSEKVYSLLHPYPDKYNPFV